MPTAPDALKFFREVVELQRASKIDAPSMSAALAEIDILQRERNALLTALRQIETGMGCATKKELQIVAEEAT